MGISVGMFSASKPGSTRDFAGQFFGLLALAIPGFVLSTAIVTIMANVFRYFPNGYEYMAPWEDPWMNFQQMMFPGLVLGIAVAAPVMRTTRSALLETVDKDFIRTAYGKGVKHKAVQFKHVLRNSLIPIVTMTGIQFVESASNRKVVYSLLEASSVALVTTKKAVAVFLVMACCCAKVKAPTNSLPILVSDGLVAWALKMPTDAAIKIETIASTVSISNKLKASGRTCSPFRPASICECDCMLQFCSSMIHGSGWKKTSAWKSSPNVSKTSSVSR